MYYPQVLSESVGKLLLTYGAEGDHELGHFILLVDQFFDICNIRSKSEAGLTRKAFRAPFISVTDERFKVGMTIFNSG